MTMDDNNDASMENLTNIKYRLVNELRSMNRMSKIKDDETVTAYEALFIAQLKTQRMQEIIDKNNKQINDFKAKIRQSKMEAFGADLMEFSFSGMNKIRKESSEVIFAN